MNDSLALSPLKAAIIATAAEAADDGPLLSFIPFGAAWEVALLRCDDGAWFVFELSDTICNAIKFYVLLF